MATVGGVVLCGGGSQRMGRSKAWLPFGNELLLPRVVRILRSVVDPVVVAAAPDQELPPLPTTVCVVRDDVADQGPLHGLVVALRSLVGRVETVYLSACDVPLLRPNFVHRVIESLGDGDVAVPQVGGSVHPLAAAYRVAPVLAGATALLEAGVRRVMTLFDRVPTRLLTADVFADVDPNCWSLRNTNTPEEYAAALLDAAGNS